MSRYDDIDHPDYACFSAGGDERTTREEREIERLVKELGRAKAEALTNGAKYDGAVAACAHFAADASRYRWLRDKRISGRGVPSLATYAGDSLVSWDATSEDTDKAIDSAIAAVGRTRQHK